MILAGQCGAFNPLMLECLLDISSSLKKKMGYKSKERYEQTDLSDIASRFHDFEMDSSEKIVQQLEFERMRYNFLAEGSRNIIFLLIPFHRRYSPLTRLAANEAGLQNLHFPRCRAVC